MRNLTLLLSGVAGMLFGAVGGILGAVALLNAMIAGPENPFDEGGRLLLWALIGSVLGAAVGGVAAVLVVRRLWPAHPLDGG